MIESVLVLSCVLYALEYAFFFWGTRRVRAIPRVVPETWPRITIIVAARNEAANIERCLGALLEQDYPADRTQIIAVNDESEDATLRLMNEIADRHPGRLTVITTREEDSHARGKARAIAQAMDIAEGEIVLLTDADCVPRTTWARAVVEHFVPGVDAYGGFTLMTGHDYFGATQQLDWLHLHTLASAALTFDIPIGIIGNNFAFRRRAYEEVGGYRTVRFTVTEDFALFRAIHRIGNRVIFPCTRDTSMLTHPCPTLLDVLRQKQRWARGGLETGPRGYVVVVVAFLMLISVSIAPFVSPTAWIGVWSTKFICDLLVMIPSTKRLERVGLLRYFILFEFYFIAQAFVVPFLLLNRNVVWKGRKYRS